MPEPAATASLDEVIRAYGPRVYSLARRLLGNEADAEDVTQDVLLQVLRKLDTFRGESALGTWLYRIAVNAALQYRARRAAREHGAPAALLEEEAANSAGPSRRWAPPPDQEALDRETRELLEAAIARLPEKLRDVYVLADVEQLPNAEVAALLGLAVPAVKSRLHRARLWLRHYLTPHFEETGA